MPDSFFAHLKVGPDPKPNNQAHIPSRFVSFGPQSAVLEYSEYAVPSKLRRFTRVSSVFEKPCILFRGFDET